MMLLLEGSLALTLIHGQRRYFDAAARAAKRLLSQPASRRPKSRAQAKKKKPDREGSGPVEFMPARDAGNHLPEGNHWLQSVAIWEDSKTACIQSSNYEFAAPVATTHALR